MAAPATSESSRVGGEETLSWGSTWTVSGGSLREAICVETSESILRGDCEEDAVSISRGLVLKKPPDPNSDPCEITVCFREKHEIHRVYVRSTARVFEIYYGLETDEDDEYLCTVRCGPAEKEASLTKDSTSSFEIPEKLPNTSSEEDGWIEIKVPESPMLENKDENMKTNDQIYFEATAEISDFSPCNYLKLRLLSLQSKEWIQIEEIYIYADPVESTDLDPPSRKREDISGHPLISMLVPSLLQLSKAGVSNLQNHGNSAKERTEEIIPETTKFISQEREHKNMVASSSTGFGHVPQSFLEKANGDLLVEKKLDELILRVGRMESFFSRLEESIMKPLSSIDSRLQRVELQLDAISSRTEFQCNTFDSDEGLRVLNPGNVGQMVNDTGMLEECVEHNDVKSVMPDVDDESSLSRLISPGFPEVTVSSSIDDALSLALKSGCKIHHESGALQNLTDTETQVKDSIFDSPSTSDLISVQQDEPDGESSLSRSICPGVPQAKASLSIDDALSLALKAFIQSGSTIPLENKTDSDHWLIQDSTDIQTQSEGLIFNSPSTLDCITVQQDEAPSNNQSFVDDMEDVGPRNDQFNMHQYDNALITDGQRDADISDDPISLKMDMAIDRSKEEADKTLKAFLCGVFQGDDQGLSHTSMEESILDVKFNKRNESSGAFHVDYLVMEPTISDTCIDNDIPLNEPTMRQDCSPDSSETAASNACAAAEALLLDLETTGEDVGVDLSSGVSLHTQQLLVSLI